MSLFALILYISLWMIAFFAHQRRIKYFGAGSAILLMFLFYSIASCYLFFTADSIVFNQKPLRVLPFLYLFLCLIIASFPVLKYNEVSIVQIIPPTSSILHIFTYIYLFCALMRIPEVLSNLSTGITMILLDVDAGQALYEDAHYIGSSTGGISNLFAIIYNVFADASIIIFFYYLIYYPKRKILLYVFGISIVVQILTQISMGLRTETVTKSMSFVIAYITMRHFMQPQLRRKLLIIGGVFVGFLMVLLIALSLSRFGDREGGFESGTINYIGMGNLVFNESVWDAKGTRNGDRTANSFKTLMGFDGVPKNIEAVRSKYASVGVDDSVFYTFVGDFVLDYGLLMTPVIFILFSALFCRITTPRRGRLQMHQLIALYFVMCVVVQGGFYLFSYSFGNNLVIIGFIVLYLLFWLDSNSKKENICHQ